MVKDFQKNWYHGKDGFGDVNFPTTPDLSRISSESAVNFMYRMVKEVCVIENQQQRIASIINPKSLESKTSNSAVCWTTYEYCIGNESVSRF